MTDNARSETASTAVSALSLCEQCCFNMMPAPHLQIVTWRAALVCAVVLKQAAVLGCHVFCVAFVKPARTFALAVLQTAEAQVMLCSHVVETETLRQKPCICMHAKKSKTYAQHNSLA
ncbi:TPA: hypothetical protein ACH3X2_006159 [Trebouxia sp. C0005]